MGCGRMAVVFWYSVTTALLLSLNFLVLSSLPEPPALAPTRAVTRRWRRLRFLHRCQTRRSRLLELTQSLQ